MAFLESVQVSVECRVTVRLDSFSHVFIGRIVLFTPFSGADLTATDAPRAAQAMGKNPLTRVVKFIKYFGWQNI